MGLIFRIVVVVLLVVAGLLGPARDATAFGMWWLTNGQAPELDLGGPALAVNGVVEVPIQIRPSGRVDIVSASVDGRSVQTDPSIKLDTTALPDGEHLLTIQA